MAARIKDVAERAGVATSTVSYVLNDGPRRVSPDLVKRVLDAIEALNYRPSGVARNMRRNQTNTIGIPPGIVKPGQRMTVFMEAMLAGITEAAAVAGKDIVMFTATHELSGKDLARCVLDQRADGLIFLDIVLQKTAVEIACRENIPHVVVYSIPTTQSPCVTFDNRTGARLALQHLFDLGHVKIAHVHGQRGDRDADERLAAYYEFMWERKLPIFDHWVEGGIFEPEVATKTGYDAVGRILLARERPTAIFSANDAMATGIYERLSQEGISIPEDMSVIGYDDTFHARECHPKLSTIQQDYKSIGSLAVQKLIEFQSGTKETLFTAHPVSLVVRDSTVRPKEDL